MVWCWKYDLSVAVLDISIYICINSTRHATHQNSVPGRVFCFYESNPKLSELTRLIKLTQTRLMKKDTFTILLLIANI